MIVGDDRPSLISANPLKAWLDGGSISPGVYGELADSTVLCILRVRKCGGIKNIDCITIASTGYEDFGITIPSAMEMSNVTEVDAALNEGTKK